VSLERIVKLDERIPNVDYIKREQDRRIKRRIRELDPVLKSSKNEIFKGKLEIL
jgi:hypothetical protein